MKPIFLFIILSLISFNAESQNSISYSKDLQGYAIPVNMKWTPIKSSLISLGKDPSWHWHKVTIRNNTNSKITYYYELAVPWLDSVKYFDQSGNLQFAVSSLTPLNERLYFHQNFIVPITLESGSDSTFYSAFQKKIMLINGNIFVLNEHEFIKKKGFDFGFFGAFSGLCLIITIFASIMWIANKENIYIYYSLYIFFYLIYFLTLYGYLRIFGITNVYIIRAAELKDWAIWVCNLSHLLFIKSYILEGHTLTKRIKWFYRICLYLFISIFFQKFLWMYFDSIGYTVPNSLLLFITFSFFSPILCTLVLLIYAIYNKINLNASKTYLLGSFPLFIYSLFSYSRNLGIVSHSKFMNQYIIIACIVFDILVLMFGLSLRYRKLKKEKQEKENLALVNELKFLKEKERISQDLHDHVGSHLTILSTGLENAAYLANNNNLKSDNLQYLNENVKLASQSLRDSIWATNFEEIQVLDFTNRLRGYMSSSIPESIEWEINDINKTNQILNSETALNAFRIIQEAIQNILKHAKSKKIKIDLKVEEQSLSVEITDNGIGFSTDLISEQTEHFGLLNMKNRVENMKGTFDLSSKIKQGTSVTFTLPILE